MRRVLLGILVLAACGEGDHTIEKTFDVCEPIAIDPGNATAAERTGIDDAIALWAARGIDTLVDHPVADAQTVRVTFETANPTSHGYYDDAAGVVYVNVDLDGDPTARAITIAHELGHSFGLYHVPDDERASVMNPHNQTVAPTAADAQQVDLLWRPCQAR